LFFCKTGAGLYDPILGVARGELASMGFRIKKPEKSSHARILRVLQRECYSAFTSLFFAAPFALRYLAAALIASINISGNAKKCRLTWREINLVDIKLPFYRNDPPV